MAEYAYNYHDIDPGGHKRQRIGPADQHLWLGNEALPTDLTAHTAYDPVRDLLYDDTIYANASCFDFASTSLNDSGLWYSDPSSQTFPQSYSFEDQNDLLTSQPFSEQTTAAFVTSIQDDFNEPRGDPPKDTTEAAMNELAHFLDVGESLLQGPIVICFGMVCPNPLVVLLQHLTCLNTDCRRPRSLQPIGLAACRIRVSTTAIFSTQLITALRRWSRRGFWKIGRANSEDFCEFIG
jgi:hypothetical protein